MDTGASGSHSATTLPRSEATAAVHGAKRSHAQMADTHESRHSFSPPDLAPLQHMSPAPDRYRIALPPLEPSIRSPYGLPPPHSVMSRRGFDHRRPVSTVNNLPVGVDVVDLTADDDGMDETQEATGSASTADSRVHLFNRAVQHSHQSQRVWENFIDLSGESSPPPQEGGDTHVRRRVSPWRTPYRHPRLMPVANSHLDAGLGVGNHRRRDESRRAPLPPDPPTPSPPRTRHQDQNAIDLTATSDPIEDEVRYMGSRTNPTAQPPRRRGGRNVVRTPSEHSLSPFSLLVEEDENPFTRLRQAIQRTRNDATNFLRQVHIGSSAFLGTAGSTGFVAPNMNYNATSFSLGLEIEPENARSQTYQAPPAPEEGFTRTPTEAEKVVCPACGDELAYGETDEKRQVWVVKACGHVYCGRCMANRSKSKSKAMGKARAFDYGGPLQPTKHFSECVVDGCKSNVKNKTSVFQIFL